MLSNVPAAFSRHHGGPEQIVARQLDGVFQQERLPLVRAHETEPFVLARERSVRGLGG
jgi:hypothetical protein